MQEIINQREFREMERECLLRLDKVKRDIRSNDARYEDLLLDFVRP
jgi:hypothetical protein